MDADARRAVGKTALVVGALGVVFGDIGTSPIYTVQTAFDPSDPHPIQASLQSVYGVVSLIFWSVTLIVTVKYVGLVMNADNEGEGGIMALISQIREIGKEVPGGGALCRHGSIGAPRDHPRLAAAGLPGLHSQLPGSGSADPGRPQCDQRTLLPAHAARGSGPARDPGDRGHRHRLAGGDLRRLLDRPPGGTARLPPAPARDPHLRARVRASLCAAHQLAPDGSRAGTGARLPELRQPRVRLRDGGDRHDRDHDDPLLRHRPSPLAAAALARAPRGGAVPRRGARVLRGEPHQVHPRRMGPAGDRGDPVHRHDDLVPWARAGHGRALPGRGAYRPASTASGGWIRR